LTNPKRILFISRCPPWPIYLGDRLILYHLGRELALRNHHLDLLAFADRAEDWDEQDYYNMDFQHVELFPMPKRSGASYLRRVVLPPARWPRTAEGSWSPDMWRAIQRRLSEEKYDIVHLFGGIQVYEFRHALKNIPTVITPYESYSLYLRRLVAQLSTPDDWMLAFRGALFFARRFEHFMFAPYDRTVVVSQPDKDELLGINPAHKIDVIPNGVDLYEFRPRPVKRIPALLFVGNYEYAPNVDAALRLVKEIFPAVQARVPNLRLWLVGNAPPVELRALASDSIRVTGRVPDVRPYLARAAAFVSPLRLGAGIKNKVLEAMAMGCPVVATPLSVDGIAVTPGQDAIVAPDGNMVDAIVRLLNDTALQEQLSSAGANLIKSRYSWDHVAEQYLALYDDVSG
jgi:glycosyltransferase involved in cell wall biosynthesis